MDGYPHFQNVKTPGVGQPVKIRVVMYFELHSQIVGPAIARRLGRRRYLMAGFLAGGSKMFRRADLAHSFVDDALDFIRVGTRVARATRREG